MPEVFLDSNILLYSIASDEPRKNKIARELVSHALYSENATISAQVISECLSVVTRRKLMSVEQASAWLDLLMPLCGVFPSERLFKWTLGVHHRFGFSFYDAQIVAAATLADCKTILTEDMQHGQQIGDLTIVNPFV